MISCKFIRISERKLENKCLGNSLNGEKRRDLNLLCSKQSKQEARRVRKASMARLVSHEVTIDQMTKNEWHKILHTHIFDKSYCMRILSWLNAFFEFYLSLSAEIGFFAAIVWHIVMFVKESGKCSFYERKKHTHHTSSSSRRRRRVNKWRTFHNWKWSQNNIYKETCGEKGRERERKSGRQSVSFKWWINGKLIRLAFMLCAR